MSLRRSSSAGVRGATANARPLRNCGSYGHGWSVWHDLADDYGNIDHLVIGPGGVFLLDSKNLWGSFSVEERVLTCHQPSVPRGDYSMPKLPGSLSAAARAVERRLKSELGWIVDVQPVVVLWADFPAEIAPLGSAHVVRGDRVAEWLRSQPKRISQEDQHAVRVAVA